MEPFNQHRNKFLSTVEQFVKDFEQTVRSDCATRQFRGRCARRTQADDTAGQIVDTERVHELEAKVLVLEGKLSLVDDLRGENERLRHALGHRGLGAEPVTNDSDVSRRHNSTEGQVCYRDFVDLSQKYISLQTRYDFQKRQIRMYDGALKKLKERCKKHEEDLSQWARFWDRKHLAIQRRGLEAEPQTPAPLTVHASASDISSPKTNHAHHPGSLPEKIAEERAPEAERALKTTLHESHVQDDHGMHGVLSPHISPNQGDARSDANINDIQRSCSARSTSLLAAQS